MRASIISVALCLASLPVLAGSDPMKAFPEPGDGEKRLVLRLPELEDEDLRRVQIIIGKTMEVDPVNRHFVSGGIEAVTIDGWGYTRYIVKDFGKPGSTLMVPPPGTENVTKFVSTGGEPFLIRYNSKLPVVVYAPGDAEVRYRVWSADGETKGIDPG